MMSNFRGDAKTVHKVNVRKDADQAAAAGAQTRFASTHSGWSYFNAHYFKLLIMNKIKKGTFYLANHHHMDANKLHDTVKKERQQWK